MAQAQESSAVCHRTSSGGFERGGSWLAGQWMGAGIPGELSWEVCRCCRDVGRFRLPRALSRAKKAIAVLK